MLANLKKLAKEFNARQTGEIVWEVSSIEFTSGKRNTTNVLFKDFEESNKFYQNVVNTFKLENVVEVLKDCSKEENGNVVFKNIVYKLPNCDKYKTVGFCLKRMNVISTLQIIGNNQ